MPPHAWNRLLADQRAKQEWITPAMARNWSSRYAGNLDTRRPFNDCPAEWRSLQSLSLERVDLSERDLDGLDVSGSTLTHVALARAGLRATDFSGCRLNHVDLRGALLFGTRFCNAILEDVDLSGAMLFHCDFSRSTLARVRWDDTVTCRTTQASLPRTYKILRRDAAAQNDIA